MHLVYNDIVMQIMKASNNDYQSDMLQFETGANGWKESEAKDTSAFNMSIMGAWHGCVPKYTLRSYTDRFIIYACLIIYYLSDARPRFTPRRSDAVYATGILAHAHCHMLS